MDEKTFASLKILLDYVSDEKRDWEENGKPENHIYPHIQRLSNWADEVAKDY